jgi:hypothetical protein
MRIDIVDDIKQHNYSIDIACIIRAYIIAVHNILL